MTKPTNVPPIHLSSWAKARLLNAKSDSYIDLVLRDDPILMFQQMTEVHQTLKEALGVDFKMDINS